MKIAHAVRSISVCLLFAGGTALCTPAQVALSTGDQVTKTVQKLMLENDDVRVYRVLLQPLAESDWQNHKEDFVTVALDDYLSESRPASLSHIFPSKAGEVIFNKRNFVHKISNTGNAVARELVIELKHHWDNEVRVCVEPRECVHKITAGGAVIGETSSLFTNGFLTAYRHRLVPGGTLTSSYYSAKGKDKIVFVPLTDMRVSFGGIDENLTRGQAYFSEATEVEANAGEKEAQWIVVRIHLPR